MQPPTIDPIQAMRRTGAFSVSWGSPKSTVQPVISTRLYALSSSTPGMIIPRTHPSGACRMRVM
jgi:hypothetical protein